MAEYQPCQNMTVKKFGASGIAWGSHIIHACRASRSICGLATLNLYLEPIRCLLQQIEAHGCLRIVLASTELSRIREAWPAESSHSQTKNDSDSDLSSDLGTLVSCWAH